MEINEKDWKLFKEKIPKWQEVYMGKLIAEYAAILSSPEKSSEKFWELEGRIKHDKKSPGVLVEMRRSMLVNNIIALLNDNVISFDDLNDFSDDLKDKIKFMFRNI